MFSKEDAPRNEENHQESTNTEVLSQKSPFATLLKSHPCTDTPPKIPSTFAEHPLRENTSGGLILQVKQILKVTSTQWKYPGALEMHLDSSTGPSYSDIN